MKPGTRVARTLRRRWNLHRLDRDRPGPRVELGSGAYPTFGYLHVDFDRSLPVDCVATVWSLPFPDSSVSTLLAIHVLEHVHPTRMRATLAEWRRVLRDDGLLDVRVPDGVAMAEAYLRASSTERFAIGLAFLGMDTGPQATIDAALDEDRNSPDHKIVLDFGQLEALLKDAGFVDVRDMTGRVPDRHSDAWSPLVRDLSLVVHASPS